MKYKDFMKDRTDCPFCGNRQEEILIHGSAYLTYALAPYTKHHLMVVPVRHVESIRDLTPEEKLDINTLEIKALDILNGLGYENCTFLMREGLTDGKNKSVAHVHFHVVPKIPISRVDADSRERHLMTPEEVSETIADVKKFL